MSKLLTIGMSTYDDFDGVYFTVQALRMYHDICKANEVEFIVLDNNPTSEHGAATKKFLEGWAHDVARYIPYTEKNSSFVKYDIANYATGKYVLILDCHVMLQPNALTALIEYYSKNPNCKDLVQGPLIYDDLLNYATEFNPKWQNSMYGVWKTSKESYLVGKPFEIPLQGMGLLSFERAHWPGISKHFKGFGAEEGYIAEKFRRNGGKNICLPQLGWLHRFARPAGVKYPLVLEDRVWNYFVGWLELSQDPQHEMVLGAYDHFKDKIPVERINELLEQAKQLVLIGYQKSAA
ncbi:MAG: glycosyltransferase family A protein [Pseudomonadota bacterium]